MENINQIPNIQPIEPIQSIPPVQNKNIFKILFIVSLIVILGIIIGFYFVLNSKISRLSLIQSNNTVNPQPISTIAPTTIPTTIPTIASTESTLVEKDTNNNLYTNNKFGFSLILPKIIEETTCQKNEGSYGLGGSEKVNLNFFENGDTIFLAGNYFYNVTGGETTSKGNYIYTGCQKIESTFNSIDQKATKGGTDALKIYATNVKSDDEMEQFIKSKYGSGCSLGEKVAGEGDFLIVKITGDGKSLDETKCMSNGVKVTYSQTKNKIVIFEVGQAYEPLDGVSSSLKFL